MKASSSTSLDELADIAVVTNSPEMSEKNFQVDFTGECVSGELKISKWVCISWSIVMTYHWHPR